LSAVGSFADLVLDEVAHPVSCWLPCPTPAEVATSTNLRVVPPPALRLPVVNQIHPPRTVPPMGLATAKPLGMGARVTVVKTWPGGSTIERDCFIEGFEIDIAPFADGAWTVTLYLSDAEAWPTPGLELNDATDGKLNTGGKLG
jgi:hypothetical protein